VAGRAYGLASYFHILLGKDGPRFLDGIEWPAGAPQPPRMAQALSAAIKRGMLNQGIDLMSGSGGFTSGVHTEEDLDATIGAFEAMVRQMQAEGLV
jgi:glutamate-1-semialdehyde aminotransferase